MNKLVFCLLAAATLALTSAKFRDTYDCDEQLVHRSFRPVPPGFNQWRVNAVASSLQEPVHRREHR